MAPSLLSVEAYRSGKMSPSLQATHFGAYLGFHTHIFGFGMNYANPIWEVEPPLLAELI